MVDVDLLGGDLVALEVKGHQDAGQTVPGLWLVGALVGGPLCVGVVQRVARVLEAQRLGRLRGLRGQVKLEVLALYQYQALSSPLRPSPLRPLQYILSDF